MSEQPKLSPVPAGYKNAAARVLPGTDQIAEAIRNRGITLLPKMYRDLFETLKELGQYESLFQRESDAVKYSAIRLGIDTREW